MDAIQMTEAHPPTCYILNTITFKYKVSSLFNSLLDKNPVCRIIVKLYCLPILSLSSTVLHTY